MFSLLSLGDSPAAVALILALWFCVNRIYLSNLPECAAGTVLSPSLSPLRSLYPFFSLFLISLHLQTWILPSKSWMCSFWSLPVFINEMNAGWQALMGRNPSSIPLPLFSFDWMSCVLLNVTHRPDCTFTWGKLEVVLLAWYSPLFWY